MKKSFTIIFILAASIPAIAATKTVKDTLGFSKSTAQTPAYLIKGMVPGVRVSLQDGNPNGAVNTNIRGINALHSDSQPLWIVDGVMLTNGLSQNLNAFWQKGGFTTKGDLLPDYSELSYCQPLNTMAFMNPYDIESIDVIKDMSATAIYGSQGANGVIIVRTRTPKNGERNINAAANCIVDFGNRTGAAFRPGVNSNYTAGVGGSLKNVYYDISAFFRNTNGIVQNVGSNYGGLKLSLQTKANSVIWFGMNTTLSAGNQSNTTGAAYLGKPSMMMVSRYPNRFSGDSIDGWINGYEDKSQDYRALTSIFIRVNFTPNFFLRGDFGADFESNTRRIWYGDGTSFGASAKGAASIMSSTLLNFNGKLAFEYNRFIADKHHITASLAAEGVGNKNKFGVMNGTTFGLQNLRTGGISAMTSRASAYKFSRDYMLWGVYGHLNYDFDGYFGLDALYRADFSTKYTGNKHIGYPAANAYLDLGKIFFPGWNAISRLRIVGGYGTAGREEYVPMELIGNYMTNYPQVQKGLEVFYDGLNRVYSKEWNVGVEMSFLTGRINLSVGYYDKNTTDNFFIYNFTKHAGEYYVWDKGKIDYSSSGSLFNKGFEFDFDAALIKNKFLVWSLFANLATNINRVTDIDYDNMAGKNIGRNIYVNIMSSGRSVSSLYGYLDDENGKARDLNSDGEITSADKVILGNTIPLVSGSFGSTLSTYGFTLDVLFDGAAGHNIANLNKLIAQGKNKLSSSYVENGDFLRLARLSVSYDIPLKTVKVKNLKVSVSGLNLFTATKYKGWNPDVNCFGSSVLSNGVDYGSYPTVRSIVLGLSANF